MLTRRGFKSPAVGRKNTEFESFLPFLNASPTSYHAVHELSLWLKSAGFQPLLETSSWDLKAEGKYYLVKEGSLIAFILPKGGMEKTFVLASHTDSPSFKLKPHAEYNKEGVVMLGLEVYGSPLLTSWLNRDLGIAGKVLFINTKNRVEEALVNLQDAPVTLAQLAIHLDRKVNDEGLCLHKQDHLQAIAAIDKRRASYLFEELKKQLPLKELLAHDLFVYPLEKAAYVGGEKGFIAGYRLDSLASVFAIAKSFLAKRKASSSTLQMMVLWDHEEIGSQTAIGAESPFFSHVLERILLSQGQTREQFLKQIASSLCLSVDLGHAVHPNYPEKSDPQHKLALGGGVLVKTHAQKRYATDLRSVKNLVEVARAHKIPLHFTASRNDIPSGTTIGPICAALTGIATVDLGIGQLSMHSARELIAAQDLEQLQTLLSKILDN